MDSVKDEYEQAVREIFAVQSAHELTIKEIMLHEKELLGLYVSASPLIGQSLFCRGDTLF